MNKTKYCQLACKYNMTEGDIKIYKWVIDKFYRIKW